jgi:Tfp pilus assembly protein PilO
MKKNVELYEQGTGRLLSTEEYDDEAGLSTEEVEIKNKLKRKADILTELDNLKARIVTLEQKAKLGG